MHIQKGLTFETISSKSFLPTISQNANDNNLFNRNLSFELIEKSLMSLVLHRMKTKQEIKLKRDNEIQLSKLKSPSYFESEHEDSDILNVDTLEENTPRSRPSSEGYKKHKLGFKFSAGNLSVKSTDQYDMSRSRSSEGNVENSQKFAKTSSPMEKFLRGVKTINLLLKATTTNLEQSKKHQKKYLTTTTKIDDKRDLKNRRTTFNDLSFNVSLFKAKKQKTLSVEAINILKTDQSLRTPQQIHLVVVAMTDTVDAFSEFPISMQEALVMRGRYEKYNPKQVIIRQGHAAQNFYFIISGLTMVTITMKNETTKESSEVTVAFLKKGNSFGELALMYGGKRNATVTCVNEVELLSVIREDFIEIFMNLSTKTEPVHIQFLRKIKILEGWPIDVLPYNNPKLCLITFFRRGTVLCRDSNNCEWVYVIYSGTCKVIKGLKQSAETYYQLRYCPLKIEGRTRQSNKNHNKSKLVYIQLNVLQYKDVFGLESVAFDQIGGSSSVALISDGAECVAINKTFFCQNMSETYLRKLRHEVQPFPEENSLVEKFQTYLDWNSFQREYTNSFLKEVK